MEISEGQLFYFLSEGWIPPRFSGPLLGSVHFMDAAVEVQR